jgi:hypothetical protein
MTSLHQAPKLTLVNFGDVLKAKMPALATHVTVTIVLALGHLGWRNRDRVISFFSSLRPRWPRQVQSCVAVVGIITLTFAIGNKALYVNWWL